MGFNKYACRVKWPDQITRNSKRDKWVFKKKRKKKYASKQKIRDMNLGTEEGLPVFVQHWLCLPPPAAADF